MTAVRLRDRRRQIWRHLRAAMRLLWRPRVSVTVIPEMEDGRIALVRRVTDDLWARPGGIVDCGEDVTGAAARELREEAGLELRSMERPVGVYSAPDRDHRAHPAAIALAARTAGEPRIGDPRWRSARSTSSPATTSRSAPWPTTASRSCTTTWSGARSSPYPPARGPGGEACPLNRSVAAAARASGSPTSA